MINCKVSIPERFEREIVTHILRVVCANVQDAPLILGIDGPPGEGKTYQCQLVLKNMGVKIYQLSAGQFESEQAGEPSKIIRKTYEEAYDYANAKTENMSAIMIDDADVAFGNWGNMYQYTVNSQMVIGELMNLADQHVGMRKRKSRVPVFITGNDLSKLYGPLKRDGRMNFFYWKPTDDEKLNMIFSLFENFDVDDCEKMMQSVNAICTRNYMPSASISFYSDLKSKQYDEEIWKHYLEVKRNCFECNMGERIINEFENIDLGINSSVDILCEMASKKIQETILANSSHILNFKGKARRKNDKN